MKRLLIRIFALASLVCLFFCSCDKDGVPSWHRWSLYNATDRAVMYKFDDTRMRVIEPGAYDPLYFKTLSHTDGRNFSLFFQKYPEYTKLEIYLEGNENPVKVWRRDGAGNDAGKQFFDGKFWRLEIDGNMPSESNVADWTFDITADDLK